MSDEIAEKTAQELDEYPGQADSHFLELKAISKSMKIQIMGVKEMQDLTITNAASSGINIEKKLLKSIAKRTDRNRLNLC